MSGKRRLGRVAGAALMGAASVFAGTTGTDQDWTVSPPARITLLVDHDTDATRANGLDIELVDPPVVARAPRPRPSSAWRRFRRRLSSRRR